MFFGGQVGQRSVLVQLVGGEDEVPVLEVAIAVVAGTLVGAAPVGTAIDVELRARAAGARCSRLPEVLLAGQADDPLRGDAERLPDLDRLGVGPEAELLVTLEDRDPDPVRIEAEAELT